MCTKSFVTAISVTTLKHAQIWVTTAPASSTTPCSKSVCAVVLGLLLSRLLITRLCSLLACTLLLLLLLLGAFQGLHACSDLLQERWRVQQPQQCGLWPSKHCVHPARHEQLVAQCELLQVGALQQLLYVGRAQVGKLHCACNTSQHNDTGAG